MEVYKIHEFETSKKGGQPPFPLTFNGWTYPFPVGGNNLGALQLLATIPMYTLYEGEKREQKKKEYEEERNKEYLEAKDFYEKNVYVGMLWYGSRKEISAKITKINTEQGYVCYAASDAQKQYIKEEIERFGMMLKPTKSGKMSLTNFISALKQGTIKKL